MRHLREQPAQGAVLVRIWPLVVVVAAVVVLLAMAVLILTGQAK